MLCASLITGLGSLVMSVGNNMAKEIEVFGPNLRVVPKSEKLALNIAGRTFNPLANVVYLKGDTIDQILNIFWKNNIISFMPLLKVPTKIQGQTIMINGVYFSRPIGGSGSEQILAGISHLHRNRLDSGRWADEKIEDEIMVTKSLAVHLNLQLGKPVKVLAGKSEKTFQVVGLLTDEGTEMTDLPSGIYAHLTTVQNAFQLENKVSEIQLSVAAVPENELSRKAYNEPDSLTAEEYDSWFCTAYITSIAQQIAEVIPNSDAIPQWKVAHGQGQIILKIQFLITLVSIIAIVASAIGVSSFMSAAVQERAPEIGLFKALGAVEEVYFLFYSEIILIGIFGGITGFFFGQFLAQALSYSLFGKNAEMQLLFLPVVMMSSVIISCLGAIYPTRQISQLSPAEVLQSRI
jgi:putative ABC transport system permease protein